MQYKPTIATATVASLLGSSLEADFLCEGVAVSAEQTPPPLSSSSSPSPSSSSHTNTDDDAEYLKTHPDTLAGGRYRILKTITTELSAIQFAEDNADGGRRVVLKRVRDAEMAQGEEAILHQIADAGVPNTVRLLSSFDEDTHGAESEDDNTTVLVFPRLEPLHLHRVQTLGRVREILGQLLTALAALHALDIGHFDVNPANLMVGEDGSLVLIDFGLARCVPEQCVCALGTSGFVAPEVYEGKLCASADVYGAGLVLGMLLADYVPQVRLECIGSKHVRPHHTAIIARDLTDLAADSCTRRETPAILMNAVELCARMLEPDSVTRITAKEALKHAFFNDRSPLSPSLSPPSPFSSIPIPISIEENADLDKKTWTHTLAERRREERRRERGEECVVERYR